MEWSFFVKAWVPFIRGCFLLVLFQINPLILKKRFFFEKSIRFLQFSRMTLLLKKFELVIHWFYLKRGQCIFTLSLLFPLREKMQFKTLCLNKCEFPHPRIRWLTFSQRFWRKCWSTCISSPMWKENGHPLLYTLYFSWTQGCIAPCLFETDPKVLEMKNFECRHCIFTLVPWSSSPWKTVWHFIWANWTSKCFVVIVVEIAFAVLHGKKMKIWIDRQWTTAAQ